MSDVIFARTRYKYDSYGDFWTLVGLSGYPIVYIDEIDAYDASKCYIATPINGEWVNGWPDAKAKIIHWDLEWRLDGQYPVIPGVKEVWASDKWYAERVGAKYVIHGSHPDLNHHKLPKNDVPTHHFAPLSYTYGRREYKINEFTASGIRIAPNAWGYSRDLVLSSSLAMLHIHQLNNVCTIAPGRFAIAASYKMPLLAEGVNDPDVYKDRVIWADYDNLKRIASDYVLQNDVHSWGESLYSLLCVEHTFKKCVEAAL